MYTWRPEVIVRAAPWPSACPLPMARLVVRASTCGVLELSYPFWSGLLCGSLVFVDEAAEDGAAVDMFQRQVREGVIWPARVELAAAMGPPPVVVGLILS